MVAYSPSGQLTEDDREETICECRKRNTAQHKLFDWPKLFDFIPFSIHAHGRYVSGLTGFGPA